MPDVESNIVKATDCLVRSVLVLIFSKMMTLLRFMTCASPVQLPIENFFLRSIIKCALFEISSVCGGKLNIPINRIIVGSVQFLFLLPYQSQVQLWSYINSFSMPVESRLRNGKFSKSYGLPCGYIMLVKPPTSQNDGARSNMSLY